MEFVIFLLVPVKSWMLLGDGSWSDFLAFLHLHQPHSAFVFPYCWLAEPHRSSSPLDEEVEGGRGGRQLRSSPLCQSGSEVQDLSTFSDPAALFIGSKVCTKEPWPISHRNAFFLLGKEEGVPQGLIPAGKASCHSWQPSSQPLQSESLAWLQPHFQLQFLQAVWPRSNSVQLPRSPGIDTKWLFEASMQQLHFSNDRTKRAKRLRAASDFGRPFCCLSFRQAASLSA